MMRYLKNLAFLALLCLGFAAQAQTTSMCDKGSTTDCVDAPTAEMADMMYGFDDYVSARLLNLLPPLTPSFAVCDKGSTTDCRNVPTPYTNNFFHSFDKYVAKRAEDVATTVVAAADTMSETEVNSLLGSILADYSTTTETEAIAASAAADAVEGYVTEAEATDIAEGVTSTALANYSTTAETQTIANEAAADAVEGYATVAQLDDYVTESQLANYATQGDLSGYATEAEATSIAQSTTSTALANYSTTAETEAIAENAAGLAVQYKADLNQVGIIATAAVDGALVSYSTTAQVQTMIDTAVANALANTNQGIAKGWFSRSGTTNHSYNMTKLNATDYRLNLTIASGKRVIPVVTSVEKGDDCVAPAFTTTSSGQPVIVVECKTSHLTGNPPTTPDQLTLVVFVSN